MVFDRLVELSVRCHLAHGLDAGVYGHLGSFPALLYKLLVLFAPLLNVLPPFKSIRHVQIMLFETGSIGDGVYNESTVGLPELDLRHVNHLALQTDSGNVCEPL